jgi:hypothetical protein
MTLTAAAIRLLAEKGLSALDIADVAEAMQPVRSANAERQKRYRDNKRNVTRNVTPPNDIYSNPPEHNPIEPNGSIAPRGRKTKSARLAIDWMPEPLNGETAQIVSAWQSGRLERELAKFKDYYAGASGRKGLKNDWQAAWRNWLRNSDEWNQGNGKSNKPSENGMGSTERAAHRALSEITGGLSQFGGSRAQVSPADFGGGNPIIDAMPNAVRSIGHVGG